MAGRTRRCCTPAARGRTPIWPFWNRTTAAGPSPRRWKAWPRRWRAPLPRPWRTTREASWWWATAAPRATGIWRCTATPPRRWRPFCRRATPSTCWRTLPAPACRAWCSSRRRPPPSSCFCGRTAATAQCRSWRWGPGISPAARGCTPAAGPVPGAASWWTAGPAAPWPATFCTLTGAPASCAAGRRRRSCTAAPCAPTPACTAMTCCRTAALKFRCS